ncbi:MAG: hypothetical protein WBN31_11615 [Gammaproteobacteria bacterium]
MSEKDIETVVLDEALVQEIIKDERHDAKRDRQSGGRVIRLHPGLRKPADRTDEADS